MDFIGYSKENLKIHTGFPSPPFLPSLTLTSSSSLPLPSPSSPLPLHFHSSPLPLPSSPLPLPSYIPFPLEVVPL